MKKTQAIIAKYAQALVVLFAFALMVLFSYLFVSDTERKYLRSNAEDAISYTEVTINSDLLEPKTFLGSVSETIRSMILHNDDVNEVHGYIKYINNYIGVSSSANQMIGVRGFYGFFDFYNDEFLGMDDLTVPEGYDPRSRPWYIAAFKASGDIAMTQPHFDTYTNDVSITFSRRIFDEEGNGLGVICLDIMLDRVMQHAENTQFVEDGYGFLISENMEVIAHPEPSMVGTMFQEGRSGIVVLDYDALRNGDVLEITIDDYRGIESIVFIKRLQIGWYMGIVTPKDNYFKSTRDLAVILAALGAIFATLLIWMLLRISSEKGMLDERVKIMFDSNPLVSYIFNKDYKIIDCNQNAVSLFDLSSKEEFCERFYDLLPEYQPDGRLTAELGNQFNEKILKEGSYRFEWTYRKLNGELIPCEITCVRVMYKNDLTVVGYMRDLREQKKMLKVIEQRTYLLDTVNSAATVLLSSNNVESFENSLLKSFALVGHCLDVDRVQIWRNETVDGELHFVLRYEWLSDYGQNYKPMPIGMYFPSDMKKEWEELFLRGDFINMPVCNLPEKNQALLGYYGIRSIVLIPMFLDGNFWGLFSIDDCQNEREFSSEEISILSSAGLMMSSAVNRNIQVIKMRETEERTQIMIDAAPLCACFWDQYLNLVDCNQEAVKMFGLSDKQEFLENFTRFSPKYQPDGTPSGRKGALLVNKALEEGYSRFEWMHQKLDGEQIPAEVTCVRVKHREEYTVIEYIRDLREQKAMMAEMRKAEIAEESSKAKSGFLAKMSHEIRTPMNAILGITEIQLQNEYLSPETKDAFERIYNSGDMLLGIINDILDLSKIEAGKLEIVPFQYDIASLVHDTVQLNIMRFESKQIEFMLDISEKVPVMLIGDELRIKQILNNLISNAFKYTDKGAVNLTVSAEPIDSIENDVMLIFRIGDTGQGMTAEQIANLGREYARFNMEANRMTEGTGLGMNITMSLIDMMKGNISIDSTPGTGSTFTVKLPQKRFGLEDIGRELADNLMKLNHNNTGKIRTVQIKREFMPYGRVLVVDDVETNLYVAKGLLAPYGLSVDVALSGFEAIDKIKNGNVYDIVFMDHMMPKMDGLEASKIIRGMGYAQPIVALTANALAGQAEMFMDNGFDDFISKPIDIRQLNTVLNKLIRDKQPPEVIEESRRQNRNMFNAAPAASQSSIDSQLREFFVRDAKKAASVLEAVYAGKFSNDNDISMFIINVHGMKSALANIGENALSAEAAKLEQAGRAANTDLIMGELPEFLERLYAVIQKYDQGEDENKEAAVNADDITHLKEKLLEIKAACALYNKKSAKDALAELKEKTWPQSVKEMINNITGFLIHSEFDEIAGAIEEYMKQL
jgi:signal transduction histidine kinase/CheY-like chemotaxis protein/HPt (histidine-containing phosphotransfer) domain-containing protein